MAKDLQISAPADTMRSLPLRLERLGNSLGTVQWPGQPMRMNFPSGAELTAQERQWIDARIKALQNLMTGGKESSTARLSLLTKLLMGYPMAGGGNEKAMKARLEFYLEAVSDVAPWALDAAIKRWVRGDVDNANVDFAPSPGALRRICETELAPFKAQMTKLERLRSALTIERAMDPKPIVTLVSIADRFTEAAE